MEGDELDITLPPKTKASVLETTIPEQKLEHIAADLDATSGALGLTLLQKILILLVITGCVVAFVRSRKSEAMTTGKSLA